MSKKRINCNKPELLDDGELLSCMRLAAEKNAEMSRILSAILDEFAERMYRWREEEAAS